MCGVTAVIHIWDGLDVLQSNGNPLSDNRPTFQTKPCYLNNPSLWTKPNHMEGVREFEILHVSEIESCIQIIKK